MQVDGADFTKCADLPKTDFTNFSLKDANFEGADLTKCIWTGAKNLSTCNFIDTKFAPVKLPDPKGKKPGAISGTVGALAATALHSVVVEIEGDSDADNDAEDDEEDEDPVEPITDDEIEVGEVLLQNLSLALNPYPRAPGVAFEVVDDDAGEPSGPFAALAQLRDMGDKSKK